MALLIKVHKKNFPGRAYVSQIDDPSYKICAELTKILNPIDEKGESFIKDTYHFKEMLESVKVLDEYTIGALDIVGMFPNVPVKKTLEVVREELQKDDTLKSRTDWEIDDIMKLLEFSIETYFKTIDGKIYFQRDGLPIVNQFQNLWQVFICIGLKKHMCSMKMENSETTLCFGRDKWMIYFLSGKVARKTWRCLCGS